MVRIVALALLDDLVCLFCLFCFFCPFPLLLPSHTLEVSAMKSVSDMVRVKLSANVFRMKRGM